jgi:FkbM family methyltransferase
VSLFQLKTDYLAGLIGKAAYIEAMHRLHAGLFDYAEFIRDTDIARIEVTSGTVIMTSRRAGIRLLCDPQDLRIAPIEILNFGGYEPAETEVMTRLIRPGMTVFDVGANIGWYSLSIARLTPGVQVHAFEPLPSTGDYLARNIALNALDNVHLHRFGFSNKSDSPVFYFYPEGSGNASAADLGSSSHKQEIRCPVRTLDSFIEETGLTVDLVKCDVEGAELFVFQGGIETIRTQHPIIFTEMLRKWSAAFNYHPNDILALLGSVGYQCFVVRDGALMPFSEMDENTIDTNFFFLHPTRHRQSLDMLAARG